MSGILEFLKSSDVLVVFAIAAIGYAIGRITIKGVDVGTAGVLLVALIFGHFGFSVPSLVNDLGVVLFVGSVGFIAGPKFFRDLKRNFKTYILIGVVVILSGFIVCAISVVVGGLPAPLASGVMTGALTSTPGLAAAKEAANNAGIANGEAMAATGYGVAYVFGVIGVVLFVQLLPKILKVDMAKEVETLTAANASEPKEYKGKLIELDPMGMFVLSFGILLGVLLGKVTIPLPGGASFSLGTSGGPLIAGLVLGHFGHIGPVSLKIEKSVLEHFREFGLCLFLIAAGVKGGNGFVEYLSQYGISLLLWGVGITLIPMLIGTLLAYKILHICLLNSLGSITGGMTSTPALGSLIKVAGTDDVATSYASTYPIALVLVVLAAQFIVILFG
jgi:putative transport protein